MARLIDADALERSFRDVMEPDVPTYLNVITGMIKATPTVDAGQLISAQKQTIKRLYELLEDVCKNIREKTEGDDVCGLCQYDGAYIGESGDWMNECPGFETNECFCMKNSIRKMCDMPLIDEP